MSFAFAGFYCQVSNNEICQIQLLQYFKIKFTNTSGLRLMLLNVSVWLIDCTKPAWLGFGKVL